MFISRKLLGVIVLLLAVAGGYFWWSRGGDLDPSAPDDFPVVMRTNGGLLEVATLKHRRTFNLTNEITILGFPMPFCKETASYTVDTYITYRVRLAQRWVAEFKQQHLYVTAPPLEPSLPVAFDTSRMRATIKSCSLVPSMDTQNDLLRRISGRLKQDALDPRRIAFVKDHGARDTVREFVQKWLISQKGYNIPANTPIDVAFKGE